MGGQSERDDADHREHEDEELDGRQRGGGDFGQVGVRLGHGGSWIGTMEATASTNNVIA